jgi:LPXTG-motif cell wall-anchored protein
MGVAARLACVALVLLALAASLPAIAGAQPAQAGPATVQASPAPTAEFSLGDLFGDENEPDENEPDEGAPQSTQSGGSGVSWPVVIGLVALAAAFGGFVYLRIRRLVLRFRDWGRGLWARL